MEEESYLSKEDLEPLLGCLRGFGAGAKAAFLVGCCMILYHVLRDSFTSCVKLNAVNAQCNAVVRLLGGGLVVGIVRVFHWESW